MEDLKQHLVNKWRASKDRYYKVLASRTVFVHSFSAKVKCKDCIPNNPIILLGHGIVYRALLMSTYKQRSWKVPCLSEPNNQSIIPGNENKRDNNRIPNFSAEFRIQFIT